MSKKQIYSFFITILTFNLTISLAALYGPKIKKVHAIATYVQSASCNIHNSTSCTASLGVTATSGNLLVAFCSSRDADTMSELSGWTKVQSDEGSAPTQESWYKISDGTETGVTCTANTSTFVGGIILEYSGVANTLTLENSATANGTSTSSSCPSVTNAADYNLYVVGTVHDGNGDFATWTNSFTEREDLNTGSGRPQDRTNVAAADLTSTGTQSTVGSYGSNGAWYCHSMSFNEIPPAFTQNTYRWYVDNDATNPTDPWGADDLAENTAITIIPAINDPPSSTQELRLRVNFTVSDATMRANTEYFKLQYRTGTDSDCSVGTWTDVGSGNAWEYATSSVTNGADITAVLSNTTSGSGQEYVKTNPSQLNHVQVAATEITEYDFHIVGTNSTESTRYLFRVVETNSAGTSNLPFTSYTNCPVLTTEPATSRLMRHGNLFVSDTEQGFFWAN